MPLLSLPYEKEWIAVIQHHIRAAVERTGTEGVVLGVSGGLDSAVVLCLAVEALGPEGVTALIMPSSNTPPGDTEDAISLCSRLGVGAERLDIDPLISSFLDILEKGGGVEEKPMAVANLHARIRMILLYHHANSQGLLVSGTSNKSELLVGYFTKYGDGGADILPIGDLYKTQVRKMAADLGVPEGILKKRPTAGLLPDQYDEEELGITYDLMDPILYGIELGLGDEEIADSLPSPLETDPETVARVRRMVYRSAHKRGIGYVPKMGFRTVGIDWREDPTW
ncbi:MAG: NAD+ synthase [Thermoplasmata archaeon]|nr:NAD+ synthase [Thermoplasmata archaeon]